MNFKLGISDDIVKGCQDVKQVLEAVRAHYMQKQAEKLGTSIDIAAHQKASSLSAFEIKELTQRMNADQTQAVVNPSDIVLEEEVDPEQVL